VRVYTTEIFYDTSRTPIDWGSPPPIRWRCPRRHRPLVPLFPADRHGERYRPSPARTIDRAASNLGGWRYLTCALSLLLVFLITACRS